jgi:hypothetical protein
VYRRVPYKNQFAKYMSAKSDNEAQKEVTDLVVVVNRSAFIENIMNQIISDFCAPRKEASLFMWSVILDTSVMPLGAKAKVVAAIAYALGFEFDRNPLHRIIAIRNAFAHNATDAHATLMVHPNPEDDYIYHQFWVLGSTGEIKMEKRHEAFDEFQAVYAAARQSLLDLRNAVKANVESGTQPKGPFTAATKKKKSSKK